MRFLLSIILIFVTLGVSAQGQFTIRHYSMEDGLSHNMVKNFQQDNDGYIWISTWNGIDKFDGYTFRNFKSYPADKVKLGNNRIENITKSSLNNIWVRTYDRFVYLFNTQTEQFENILKQAGQVSSVFALDKGITWVIADNGDLYRIDENKQEKESAKIQIFSSATNTTIGNTIHTIFQDSQGDEWLLTNKGITIVGKKKIMNNMPFEFISEINNAIYLASSNGYIASYEANGNINPLVLPVPFKRITALKKLQDNALAVLGTSDILIYDTKTKSTQTLNTKEEDGDIDAARFFQDSRGFLWMFTNKQKIICYHPSNRESILMNYPDLSKIHTVQSSSSFFHEDEHGHIWALLREGVFCFYNPQNRQMEVAYTEENGEKSFFVAAAKGYFIDTHKNIWLNTWDGFDYLSFKKKNHDLIFEKKAEEVRGMLKDSNGRLWVGTKGNRIEIYDQDYNYIGNLNKEGKIEKNADAIFGAAIYCLCEDKQNNIWMGSKDNGLFLLTPQKQNTYNVKNFLPKGDDEFSINSPSVYSILQDSKDRIWIGTFRGGINLIEKDAAGEFKFIHYKNQLKNYPYNTYSVRCFYETKNGIMMAGTTNGLLTFPVNFKRIEEVSFFHNISEPERTDCLSNNDIMNINQSRDGNIYISTFSGGIDITDTTQLLTNQIKFRNFNKTNGLSSDLSLSTTEDKKGFIWIASVNSISRFDPSDNTFENFDKNNLNTDLKLSEGIPLIDKENRLIFGTTNGVLRILTDQLQKSNFVPPIVFTNVSIQNRDGKADYRAENISSPTLSPSERNITISFAALDYSGSGSIQYAYRMKGIDDQWIYIDKNRSAGFVNLPHGKYVFQVKSTNGDGVWMDNIASLPIHVTPSFWETGWAWFLYIIIFLLVSTSVIFIILYILNLRRKVDFEQQLTQLKLRFFTDISHELRTPLTLIASPIDEVINNEPLSDNARENMITAKRNTDRMLRLINQILDFRKIQNNKMKVYLEQTDVITLTKKVFYSFQSIAHQKQINYHFHCDIETYEMYTDTDKFEKILFNLLSNAFKYTPDNKNITLDINIRKEELYITVQDEGVGIDIRKIDNLFNRFETTDDVDPKVSSGIGLSLVKELVNLLHGRIEVESQKGKGSTFLVKLPGKYESFANNPLVEFILKDNSQPELQPEEKESPDELVKNETSILIIEDNHELRHFIKNILSHDYKVLEAENGKQGLEITQKELPDIVVSDIMMPEIDGIEYLNTIRKNPETSHIPVILLTAKSSLDDQIKGMEYGADDYITKPFNSTFLKARILALLKQRELLRDHYLSKEMNVKVQLQPNTEWEPSVPKITNYDDEFIRSIIQSIEDNIENTEFRIEDLAYAMNMSRAVFYRKVKTIVGLSPVDFVKKMRIKRAVQLLETEHFSIAEVAYKSGFSTPQYLSKVFKEQMGCSPTEYKQKKDKSPGNDFKKQNNGNLSS